MNRVRNQIICLLFLIGAITTGSLPAGCSTTNRDPYRTSNAEQRNPLEAQRLTQKAAAQMQEDPESAETLLLDALTADLYHGPAHNNLGVLLLGKGDLYGAANEFEWARKLMPGHPDPRVNLSLTLERAGRTDEAMKTYERILEKRSDGALAPVAGKVCQGCFTRLPPQWINMIQIDKELVTCPQCGRIVYIEE